MNFLKFKVWDKDNKAWIPHKDLLSVIKEGDNGVYVEPMNHIAVTCTGVRDKANRDVFYGDVLLCDNLHYVVEYDDTGAFTAWNGDQSHYFFDIFGFEIIGNVFENPELAENLWNHNKIYFK